MGLSRLHSRFMSAFRDPDMRANVLAVAGGKAIGLILLLTAMRAFSAAGAARRVANHPPDQRAQHRLGAARRISRLLHAGGFVMLEAGLPLARVDQHPGRGIVDTHLRRDVWAWGFAFMFEPGTGLIGMTGFSGGPAETYGTTGVPLLAYWVFQFALPTPAHHHVRCHGRPLQLHR